MWQNNFRLAWRALLRQRQHSLINLLGLAVSIAACLLLYRMVRYELSFDRQHRHYDRIARIVTAESNAEGTDYTCGIPIPAMDVMQGSVPQFEQFARLHAFYPQISVPLAPGQKFATDGLHEVAVYIEPSFFRIFDWNWLAGDPLAALSVPKSAVLPQAMAEKCFGNWQTAVGKTIVLDQHLEVVVRGIVSNPPPNSDFPFNLLVSYATLKNDPGWYGYTPEWGNISSNDQAWALLQQAHQAPEANALLAQVGKKEYQDHVSMMKHFLQPLSEQHFDDRIGHLGTHTVTKSRLWTLSLIGMLILIMACFNFINLTTAQAASRSKEVGVRKTLGSSRQQLLRQFMGETGILVSLAVLLGASLASLASPLLNQVSDVPSQLPFLTDPLAIGFLLALTVLVSILAGIYPAIVLSGFAPVRALKNNLSAQTPGGVSLRKILVVLQFGIAQALIIGTLVTINQMNYIRSMDLGYRPALVYTVANINSDSLSHARFGAFKHALEQIPAVESVSFASDVPTSGNNWDSNFAFNQSAEDAPFSTHIKVADENYLKTYGLRLLAGSSYQASDTSRSVVVNRLLLKKLGVTNPQDAIGKTLRLGSGRWRPIVGVIEDFTSNSAREPAKPTTLLPNLDHYSTAGIKIRGEDVPATLAAIRQVFDQTFPEQVFDGNFLDNRIAEFYLSEHRFAALCKGFAGLAIFIACLGLFGLASLLAAQKTKEIGVRKVLGASVASVVGLLSKDFLLLVLSAFLLAAPVAWWAMDHWLQDFVYRTSMGWWVFAATSLLVLAVAFLTISYQAIKAATANPVNSLRNE